MNYRIINPFLEGTKAVLQTMAFIEPKAGEPFLKTGDLARGDVSGIIGLTGDLTGSLALSFSEKCILKIVSNMLCEEISSLNGEIRDAVGELTNMISGAARQKLESEGIYMKAAIPTVVSGENHSIKHVLAEPSIIIPFETDAGPFFVDVCVS